MPIDPLPEAQLTRDEADALQALREPVGPPSALFRLVVGELRVRGAFRGRPTRWAGPAAIAAAITLAFLAGRRVGEPAAAAAQQPGPAFAIFLLNAPAIARAPGTSDMQIVEEYRAWAQPLGRDGRLAFADELAPERYLVDAAGARQAPSNDGVGGMFVVRARDVSAALALAGTLPHVRQGGVVAVQPVMNR